MNRALSHRPRRAVRAPQTGSSILEVLLGFFILLLVLVGLLPLFTRAVGQNAAGRESTEMTAFGSARLESRLRLGFNNWELQVTSGSSRRTTEFQSRTRPDLAGDGEWLDEPPAKPVKWRRTTEVRQFAICGVRDHDGDGVLDTIIGLEDADRDGYFDHPLPAEADPAAVHLKEIRVHLRGTAYAFGSGPSARLTLTSLKGF